MKGRTPQGKVELRLLCVRLLTDPFCMLGWERPRAIRAPLQGDRRSTYTFNCLVGREAQSRRHSGQNGWPVPIALASVSSISSMGLHRYTYPLNERVVQRHLAESLTQLSDQLCFGVILGQRGTVMPQVTAKVTLP